MAVRWIMSDSRMWDMTTVNNDILYNFLREQNLMFSHKKGGDSCVNLADGGINL